MRDLSMLVPKMKGGSVYNMKILLNTLSPSSIVPEVNKYYVFIYKPKTRNIKYDRHPFVVCTSLHKWGFIGFNYHWTDYRRYSWSEMVSNLYEVKENEVGMVQSFDIAKFMRS